MTGRVRVASVGGSPGLAEALREAGFDLVEAASAAEAPDLVLDFSARPRPGEPPEAPGGPPVWISGAAAALVGELLQACRRDRRELAALSALAGTAGISPHPDAFLQMALDTLMEVAGAEGGVLRILDEETDELVLRAHRGRSARFVEERRRVLRTEPRITAGVLLSNAFCIEDLAADPRGHDTWAREEGYRAFMGAPLRARERPIGTLSLFSRTPARFTARDLQLLTSMADRIAVGVENARLFQEVVEQSAKAGALGQLSRMVSSTLDRQQVFDFIVRAVTELLEASVSTLWVLEEGEALVLGAGHGTTHARERSHVRLKLGEGLAGWVAERKAPLSIREILEDPRLLNRAWAQAEGFRAFAGVPLLRGERCLGSLTAVRRTPRPFRGEEIGLLRAFADQAAIAVENAQLFGELKQAYEELQRTQAQLVEAEKLEAITALAGAAAHELNQPLATVGICAELLLRAAPVDAFVREQLQTIQREAQRMAEIVLRVGRITRFETKAYVAGGRIVDLERSSDVSSPSA